MKKKKSERINALKKGNVVLNSFHSCIAHAPEKFTWAPEMPLSEILSEPGMFSHEFKGRIAFKQLQSSRNTHCWGQFNKQMHMILSNMQFIDSAFVPFSSFSDKSFTIKFDNFKLERIPSIFRLPHKMESILPEGMIKTYQIHFLSPASAQARELTLSKHLFYIEGNVSPLYTKDYQELNIGDGNSSLGLKAEVSLPFM